MTFGVTDDPVAAEDAIAFFRDLLHITKDEWEELSDAAKAQAFTVAGVAELDTITDVWEAIDAAIADGTTFDTFVESVGDVLENAWGGTVENPGWRLETIFRTNVQRAYSVGRYKRATDDDVADVREFWMFDGVDDDRETDVCADCNGVVKEADDPWWSSHVPPLHFNCRSKILTLTPEQAEAMGVTKKLPRARADEGFGAAPEDDEDDWSPDASDYPRQLWAPFKEKLARDSA